jgi:hypothetical protein
MRYPLPDKGTKWTWNPTIVVNSQAQYHGAIAGGKRSDDELSDMDFNALKRELSMNYTVFRPVM